VKWGGEAEILFVYLGGLFIAFVCLCVRFIFIVVPKYKNRENISFASAIHAAIATYLSLPLVFIKCFMKFKDVATTARISTAMLNLAFC
jgi:hypothetical protein